MHLLRAFCTVCLMWLAAMAGPQPIFASPASDKPVDDKPLDSIFFVSLSTSDDLRPLLNAGVCVSRQLAYGAILFGDAQTLRLAMDLGYEVQLLEDSIADREHYVVWAERKELMGALQQGNLLYSAEGFAIVSIAAGEVQSLVGLGRGIEKLFRSPLQLPRIDLRAASRLPQSMASRQFIAGLVAQVSEDSLVNNVLELEAFGTRHATTPQGRAVAGWLQAAFLSYGISDVEIHQWDARFPGNVIATIPGTDPEAGIYVLGGHYDSVVPESSTAPGADDNATGTASVLECARILAPHKFRATIRLIGFSAEELGLVGSANYAQRAALRGEFIVGMINVDMLGYLARNDVRDVDLIVEQPSSDWLRKEALAAQAAFVPELSVVSGKLLSGSSDHASFLRKGFDAIFLHEDSGTSSPYIHTVNDIFGTSYNDPVLHTGSTRIALAMLATLAEPVTVAVVVQSFVVVHTKQEVQLGWELSPQAEQEITGVHIERATDSAGPFSRRTLSPLPPGARSYVDTDVISGTSYWYRLALENLHGEFTWSTAVLANIDASDLQTALDAPFWSGPGGHLQIRYRIGPAAATSTLRIYDVRGRQIRTLAQGLHVPGEYLRTWDRRDSQGGTVASGIYIVRLGSMRANLSRKVTVLRQ